MDSLPLTTEQRLVHSHILSKAHGSGTFTCSGCNFTGSGTRYKCSRGCAAVSLHPKCALGPTPIESYKHPRGSNHQLKLFMHRPNSLQFRIGGVPSPSCTVCSQTIHGLYYKCVAHSFSCQFLAHPLCVPRWPEYAGHPEHPSCRLKLKKMQLSTRCFA
ncbi:hypothetical protein JCGZ_00589 [Jatropha curcas]|uniref:Uncharacterized protein n=1 Tax=Jatropha curcas TaxID=180498 RepID=A0A067JDA7_JATCU|nr:hypothetical protein JCGZ_00589 [Jatropha curcas]